MTTAYAELAAPRWERRQALLRHHLFDIDAAPLADSGAAGGAAASGLQGAASQGSSQPAAATQAALQCLPQQQLVATLPLPLAEGAGELRLYACQLPPWPHDSADPALTAVVLAAGAGSGAAAGASSSWGGMWGSLEQADSAATAASQSFGVDGLLEAAADAGAVPVVPGSSSGTTALATAGGATAQQQPQRPLLHCWSPAVEQQQQQQHGAIEQLAQRYAAALQLQQGLEGLLAGGRAAGAVQQLALALQALSGPPASSAGGGRGSASLALGPRHILRMRLLADLHRAAVAAGQWDAALRAAYQLLPLHQQAYQPVGGALGSACQLPAPCCSLLCPGLPSLLQRGQNYTCPLPLLPAAGVAATGPAVGQHCQAGAPAGAACQGAGGGGAGAAHPGCHARQRRGCGGADAAGAARGTAGAAAPPGGGAGCGGGGGRGKQLSCYALYAPDMQSASTESSQVKERGKMVAEGRVRERHSASPRRAVAASKATT